MKISEIVRVARGRLLSGDPDTNVDPSRISTDSRNVKRGDLFIALKGPNFDGGKFVAEAFGKGAIGAISSFAPKSGPGSTASGRPSGEKIFIKVKDATEAFQRIAAAHRNKFKIPVIGITGSNGKTTVKDLASAILSGKYKVLKNEGTDNNHIGVPKTLLKLNKDHDICVLELGTNHPGEIKKLCRIASPTAAVITNIGLSHIEFFGDLEGVYRAKTEILSSAKGPKGKVIINGDDKYLKRIKPGSRKLIRFGFDDRNDYKGSIIGSSNDKVSFSVNSDRIFISGLLGIHNVYNALGAIAIGRSFEMPYQAIIKAVASFKPTKMRMEIRKICGVDVINDAYNSNPQSMSAALEVLENHPAISKWVVSGDMFELGSKGEYFHRMIGVLVAKSGADGLLTMGKLSKFTLAEAYASGMRKDRLWHCADHAEASKILGKFAKSGDLILIKGSRGMRMERVLEKLKTKTKK